MTGNELQHWGIKGMKWGVRRYQNEDGTLTSAGKKRYNQNTEEPHEDYKRAHERKSASAMSDAELRNRLNRLQMERQYRDLTGTEIKKGKQYFDKVLKIGTTAVAVSNTALAMYGNYDKIKKIVAPMIDKLRQ